MQIKGKNGDTLHLADGRIKAVFEVEGTRDNYTIKVEKFNIKDPLVGFGEIKAAVETAMDLKEKSIAALPAENMTVEDAMSIEGVE